MTDKPSHRPGEDALDNHIPILKDAVIPGEIRSRSTPTISSETLQQLTDSTPESAVPAPARIPERELEMLLDQAMEELRLELDNRISGLIRQALEDTIRSTLHQQEERLKQRLLNHLEQRLPELMRTQVQASDTPATSPGPDSGQAEV